MSFLRHLVAVLVCCFLPLSMFGKGVVAQSAPSQQTLPSVAKLAADLSDSVVNISILQTVKGVEGGGSPPAPTIPEGAPFEKLFEDFFSNEEGASARRSRNTSSQGSGFVVDAVEGLIVTNHHVIADADEIEVNFVDGSKLKAILVGKDTKTDLALIKVDPTLKNLKAVTFGDSDRALIGDWVLAIGNPFGLGGTVTLGIISARNRDINSGPYDDFIQTDAAINRGNSGGPLFNMAGEVIGVNTAIISPSGGSIGIGFAIPSKMVVAIIHQLKTFGETRRGQLGLRIQQVTQEVADSLNLPKAAGALVSGRIEGTDNDNQALHIGDVIIRFAGQEIKNARDLPRIVAESAVGQSVEVVVLRDGLEKTVMVTLGLLDENKSRATGETLKESKEREEVAGDIDAPLLGMWLKPLDEAAYALYSISPEIKGVVVALVEANSAAANKRVVAGSVIVEINQEQVTTPAQIYERVQNLRNSGRKNALLLFVEPSGELRFVTLLLD